MKQCTALAYSRWLNLHPIRNECTRLHCQRAAVINPGCALESPGARRVTPNAILF